MGFLRRLLGGDREPAPTGEDRDGDAPPPGEPAAGDDETARHRDLLRAEAERLDHDLLQRQLRYADRSWTPPRQGGDRRAGDEEAGEG
jgi:hypothetical protein